MLDPLLLFLIMLSIATSCFRAFGYILFRLSWELYELRIFFLATIVCSFSKLFVAKGNLTVDKIFVKEGITQMRDRLQTINREIHLLQMKAKKFQQEFGNHIIILSDGAEKTKCKRDLDALEEFTQEISGKVSIYELDRAKFLRDVRNMGPWAAAYLYHQPV